MTNEYNEPKRDGKDADPEKQPGRFENETEPLSLEDELLELSEELGFIETQSLRVLRESISPTMPEADSFRAIGEYQTLARQLTPPENDPEAGNIVLAVNVAGIAVILRSGRNDDARDSLQELVMVASTLEDDDLADYLRELKADIV